ncbi:MAG: alpha/beta fold hydrolase [Candidatus Hermodarchaeota archaeon]
MPHITRDGYRLFYYHTGKISEGYPVVFIHGYLGSSQTHWGHQLNNPKLLSQFQLIAPDLRGYGKSSIGKKVEKHKTSDHILDLRFLLTQLQLQQKPILVGYSIGGTLALMYTLEYPESVQGIILVSPRPFLGKITRSWNFMAKEKRIGQNRSYLISFLWVIVKRVQKYKTYISVKRRYKRLTPYFQQLEQIKVPLLMLYGSKDSVNPSIVIEILKKHLPQADVIEFDSDHGIVHENTEEFNKILLQFLTKNLSL